MIERARRVAKEQAITGQITTYAWDAENRMTRWEQAGTTHALKYTGDGKRIELVRTPGIDTRYVWDGQNIQNETNLGGVNRDVYTYDPAGYGRLLSLVLQGGTERFLVFDALGSVDRLLATNQSVTDQYLYEAFGKEVLKTGTTRNPFRWLGEIGYYTETETAGVPVYVRARQYSPVSGRWLKRDEYVPWIYSLSLVRSIVGDLFAARLIGSFSISAEWYEYCNNLPTRWIDPDGRQYIDGNVSLCCPIGPTGGLFAGPTGIHPYLGGAVGGPGVSLTCAPHPPCGTINAGGWSGQLTVTTCCITISVGYGGGFFWEVGGGLPSFGCNASVYYTW